MSILNKGLKPAPFRKSKLADRGKVAEDKVKVYLDGWAARDPRRDFDRLVDTKAAGRVIRAAAADYEFFCTDGVDSAAGLIEVKETEHPYRLDRKRLTQSARLRKRAKCGCAVFVLVYHSALKKWRTLSKVQVLDATVGGSWDLRDRPLFDTPGEALVHADGLWGDAP